MNPAQSHVTIAYTVIAVGLLVKHNWIKNILSFASSPPAIAGTYLPQPASGQTNQPPAVPPVGQNG